MDIPVIDAHIHVQPWRMVKPEALRLMQGNRPDVARLSEMMYDPAMFLRHLDEERIERVVNINYVSPDIMGFSEEALVYAADYARRCGGRMIAVGSVHPTLTRDPDRAMDGLIAAGFRGIKMHPSHQPCRPNAYREGNRVLETAYRRAEEAGLVLVVHTGTSIFPGARNVHADPIYCDDIAIDFPRLRIVLAHGGRPLWMETALFLARRFPNVTIDLSGIPPGKLLEYFPRLEEFADKMLWGSDWPAPGVRGMRANADRFLELPLSDGARRKILHENAERVFGP
ncbi:MAG: amidohydrolase [Planctomycetes bacterium]|nr:amidohydrolase [Planctomycetota bacterium]